MCFGHFLHFQEWRCIWEEQIQESLFRCRVRSFGINLVAAEITFFLLQPDGAMAFAASISQE